jgi:hypothetical protein
VKFSTFIIIALLALIAYALLRPAPAPNTMQEFLRLAQQLIPPAKTGGQETQPVAEQQALPKPNSGGEGLLPAASQPNPTPKSEAPAKGILERALPHLTWDPFEKGDDAFVQKQYSGRVRQHLYGDTLLMRSGTKPDSGSGDEYVLAGFPGAADLPLDAPIEFYAYSAGAVTLEYKTETKSMSVLVYSSAVDPKNQQPVQNQQSAQNRQMTPIPQPAQDTPPPKPGSWMWNQKNPLDLGPYNRK